MEISWMQFCCIKPFEVKVKVSTAVYFRFLTQDHGCLIKHIVVSYIVALRLSLHRKCWSSGWREEWPGSDSTPSANCTKTQPWGMNRSKMYATQTVWPVALFGALMCGLFYFAAQNVFGCIKVGCFAQSFSMTCYKLIKCTEWYWRGNRGWGWRSVEWHW